MKQPQPIGRAVAVFDFIAQSTPLRSVTTPEELADTTLFFAGSWGLCLGL